MMKSYASSIRGKLNQVKIKKENPKKSEKRKIQKKLKKKEEKRKKKNLFSVILDKICVFCLYPIPDSQQCVKRGSCRHPILSGLLCSFSRCFNCRFYNYFCIVFVVLMSFYVVSYLVMSFN